MSWLSDRWESLDFWDKEENRKQQAARTERRAVQAAPAITKKKDKRSNVAKLFSQANPFDDGKSFGNSESRVEQQRRLSNEADAQLRANNIARRAGLINNDQFSKDFDAITKAYTPALTPFEWAQQQQADAVSRNNIARPVLTGLATLSPTSYGGEIAAYAGRGAQALGWDDGKYLAQAGDNVANYSKADQEGDFRNRGFGDSLIHGGIELAGDIVNPVTRLIAPVKYATRSANDLAREMEATGQYTPQQSFLAGTGLGVISGALERTGIDKITGKAVGKGIRGVTTRLVTSGLTEGATEGAQTFAENAFRNKLVDENQGLLDGVGESALLGGILGAGARGAIEVGSNPRVQQFTRDAKNTAKRGGKPTPQQIQQGRQAIADYQQERNILAEQFARQRDAGKVDSANYTSQKIQEIDNELDFIKAFISGEGGFLAGSKATDFSKQQEAGRVFEGVDGKPRFEVDDSGAKIKNRDGKTLGELLDHKELFDQYPQLKNISIVKQGNMKNGADATVRPLSNGSYEIGITPGADKSHILHEVQHLIQETEGFAKGGTIASLDADRINAIDQQIKENIEGFNKLTDRATKNKVADYIMELQDQKRKLEAQPYTDYRNLAGEAEARAVASRMNMSDGERYKNGKNTFDDSLDVPKEDLIIRDGGGKAMSVDPQKSEGYKYMTRDGSAKYKQLNKSNSFQDINGTNHPLGSDAKITVKNFDGTNETRTFTVEDIGSQEYFNKQLIKYGERGEVVSATVDSTPVLVKPPQTPLGKATSQTTQLQQETGRLRVGEAQNEGRLQVQQPTRSQDVRVQDLDTSSVYSQETPNQPSIPSSQETGNLLLETDKDIGQFTNQDAEAQPDWEAPARNPRSKASRQLVDSIVQDNQLTEAARQAQLDGEQLNYFAKKDKNDRSIGVEQFDPQSMRIESGFVIDNNTQKILGNHIKVDDTGISVNVGGSEVNINNIIGNPMDWEGSYRVTETFDRNLQRLAPNKKIYQKTRNFVVDHKTKSEAVFREELGNQRKALRNRTKSVMKAKPSKVSKTDYKADIFDYIEGNLTKQKLSKKYDKQTVAVIEQYRKETRTLYDNLLDRVNETFGRFGEEQVARRKDYLTHINELSQKPSFAGELYGRLQNSFLGEGMATTRGAVPASIEGRTENFAPRKKWNRFFQQRNGGEFTKDPFAAVDAYVEPTLYNIHMTESAVRARALESAFRTADEIRQTDKQYLNDTFAEELGKYSDQKTKNWTAGIAEYANALTGKTQRLDRQVIDMSPVTAQGLRGWQQLQRIGGRATVLANASSIVSQSLNQPLAIADAGIKNYTKGLAKGLAGKTPIDKSPFIRARQADVSSDFRSNFDKVTDFMGKPLQLVELAFVKQTWNAQYQKALSDGFDGQKAIMEADRRTEQTVAGRGIADKPEVYRSTVANGFLQYTLEVSATNKKFWQDLNTTQKAEFIAATWAMNNLVGLVTGFEPLPDYLEAAIDSIGAFFDEEDERSSAEKVGGGLKRFAGETVSMNPQATAATNIFMDQQDRKDLFGEDSDVSRFEGTSAPIKVVQYGKDALFGLGDAAKAETTEQRDNELRNARDNILRGFVPGGNQARKSLTGAEMNQRGYAVDKQGNPTFAAPDNKLGQTQSVLFGPYSTDNARNYFDNKQSSIEGKGDLASIRGSSDPRQTVADIQQRKTNKKEREGIVAITDSTTKDSAGDYVSRDKYDSIIHAYEGGKYDKNIGKYDSEELRNAIKEVSGEAYEMFTRRGLDPAGIKFNSNLAQEYAKYKKKMEGANTIDQDKYTKSFLKDSYNSQLDEIERDLYSLSEDALKDYFNSGTLTEENLTNALTVERQLFEAGLIDKETLARKLDLEARGYKTAKSGSSRGGGSRSKKSKFDYSILGFGGGSSPTSVTKSLRSLFDSATIS